MPRDKKTVKRVIQQVDASIHLPKRFVCISIADTLRHERATLPRFGVFEKTCRLSQSASLAESAANSVHPGNTRPVGADSQADPVNEPGPIRIVPLPNARGSKKLKPILPRCMNRHAEHTPFP